MDYHLKIVGTPPTCGGCDPFNLGCFVDLQWPSLGGTNRFHLGLAAGSGTRNQTWVEPARTYDEAGTWHWWFYCRTANGADYSERMDEGSFVVAPAPSPTS